MLYPTHPIYLSYLCIHINIYIYICTHNIPTFSDIWQSVLTGAPSETGDDEPASLLERRDIGRMRGSKGGDR